MGDRLSLHNKLVEILNSKNAYYQPPANVNLVYPCVIYNQNAGDIKKANNKLYKYTRKYEVTFIFKSSNDDITLTMLDTFKYCTEGPMFITDNLYHYTFELYY